MFARLAYGQRQEGIVAIARAVPSTLSGLALSAQPLVVVVESIEKPGNLGAVLRTCDAAGVEALLVSDPQTDVFNPNVIRASLGTVFSVPIAIASPQDIVAFLQARKIQIFGLFPDAVQEYTQTHFSDGMAIVLGAEDKGLSAFWQTQCAHKVRIPMRGLADSLNVSVSAAIVIFEAVRQRGRP